MYPPPKSLASLIKQAKEPETPASTYEKFLANPAGHCLRRLSSTARPYSQLLQSAIAASMASALCNVHVHVEKAWSAASWHYMFRWL